MLSGVFRELSWKVESITTVLEIMKSAYCMQKNNVYCNITTRECDVYHILSKNKIIPKCGLNIGKIGVYFAKGFHSYMILV